MGNLASLLPLVLIVAFFWLFILRPARNRQREAANLQTTLAPGSHVMTGGGLFATVHAIEDDKVVLETSPGVLLTFARGAISKVLPDEIVLADVPADDVVTGSSAVTGADSSLSTGTPVERSHVDLSKDPQDK